MAATRKRRDDPRRESTRSALIEAAERLFAEQGVDSVSTRQIGTAIGALNTNVVAYHFGSKEALIEAVFHSRLPQIDQRRGEMLAELEASGTELDVPALMRVFAWPLFEQTNAEGQHTYACFLGGLERSGRIGVRGLVIKDYPQTERLSELLKAHLPPDLAAQHHLRIRLAVSLIVTALQVIDRDPASRREAARDLFENVMAMASAAFIARPAQGRPQ